jgi:hypothetical protein
MICVPDADTSAPASVGGKSRKSGKQHVGRPVSIAEGLVGKDGPHIYWNAEEIFYVEEPGYRSSRRRTRGCHL